MTKGLAIDSALNIVVDEAILLDRIAKRASIENRKDDAPEIAKQRLENQRRTLEEVTHYYRNQDKLLEVDGFGPVEEIHQRVVSVLEKINKTIDINYRADLIKKNNCFYTSSIVILSSVSIIGLMILNDYILLNYFI